MRGSQIGKVHSEECQGYRRHQYTVVLDSAGIARAETVFLKYRVEGVIMEGQFRDDIWTLTDEVRDYRFRFSVDAGAYAKGAGTWSGLTEEVFMKQVKAFVTLGLGTYALSTLLAFLTFSRKVAAMEWDDACRLRPQEIQPQMIEFLGMVDGADAAAGELCKTLEERYGAAAWKDHCPRGLSSFEDYLVFDRKQREYWERAGTEEKTEYFPVWFWWNLTAVLPLRPTEYLLTPWECLEVENGRYVLLVRRTLQKKAGHKYRYHIETDYGVYRYQVPEKLATEIFSYKEKTASRRKPGDWALCLPGRCVGKGHMEYAQLKGCLDSFLNEIGRPELSIRLGDTRHLAMASLILSGGSPEICRELAGHEDINVSSNYYSNIPSLIESAVYDRSRNAGCGAMLLGMPARIPPKGGKLVETAGGWCDYPAAWEGEIGECMKNYKRRGMLGACEDCIHYYPGDGLLRLKIRECRKQDVSDDAAFLVRMIDAVRKGLGHEEDIDAAMARLSASGQAYAAWLWNELKEEQNAEA